VRIDITQEQAEALGIVHCECGHPPSNHFRDQPKQRCAHCGCKAYQQRITLPEVKTR
jgi:hypothetical protein